MILCWVLAGTKYRLLRIGNIYATVCKRYPNLKMAACLSFMDNRALPPVHVLSHIPKLAETIISMGLPELKVKNIDVSDVSEENPEISEVKLATFQRAEILVCDGNLLAKVYKHLPDLVWAHCTWAGVDSLMKEICGKPSFTLTRHTGDAFSFEMAEYVLCHVINCERKTLLCYNNQRSSVWSQDEIKNYRNLRELTILLLGVGEMASKICKQLVLHGATVNGFAKNVRSSAQFGDFNRISTHLEDLLVDADYVVNTLPSTPLTRGILNSSLLNKCTKHPYFINVGRGDVIEENVLVDAIRSGCLSGAVLDVFETEPLPESSFLWGMPQVIITPHVAAVSRAKDIAEEFTKMFWKYVQGEGMRNRVSWTAGY